MTDASDEAKNTATKKAAALTILGAKNVTELAISRAEAELRSMKYV